MLQQNIILPQTMYPGSLRHDHVTPVAYGIPQTSAYPYIQQVPFNHLMVSFGNYDNASPTTQSMYHVDDSENTDTRKVSFANGQDGVKVETAPLGESRTVPVPCFMSKDTSMKSDIGYHRGSAVPRSLSTRLCLPNIKASDNFAENVMSEESDLGYSSFCDMNDIKLEDMATDMEDTHPNLSNILDDVLDTLDEHLYRQHHSRLQHPSDNDAAIYGQPSEKEVDSSILRQPVQKSTSPVFPYAFQNVVFNFQNLPQDVPLSNWSREQHRSTFCCSICRKSFNTRTELTLHTKLHKDVRPHECPYCQKRFTQKSTLRTHVRTHTGEKPFSCHYCARAFGDYSTFRKHVRIHTGEKPYTCDVCKKSFTQSGNMLRHREIHNK